MDEQTRVILLLMTDALSQIADDAYHTEEMAWRTYAAHIRTDPAFENDYKSNKGISFERIHQKRLALSATLGQIKQILGD